MVYEMKLRRTDAQPAVSVPKVNVTLGHLLPDVRLTPSRHIYALNGKTELRRHHVGLWFANAHFLSHIIIKPIAISAAAKPNMKDSNSSLCISLIRRHPLGRGQLASLPGSCWHNNDVFEEKVKVCLLSGSFLHRNYQWVFFGDWTTFNMSASTASPHLDWWKHHSSSSL